LALGLQVRVPGNSSSRSTACFS